MLDQTLGRVLGAIIAISYALYTAWLLIVPIFFESSMAIEGAKYVVLALPVLVLSTGLAVAGLTAGCALWLEPDRPAPRGFATGEQQHRAGSEPSVSLSADLALSAERGTSHEAGTGSRRRTRHTESEFESPATITTTAAAADDSEGAKPAPRRSARRLQ